MNDDFFIQGFVKAEMKKRVTYKPCVQIRTTCLVISATCTCPAGGTPAFCKHVFALLHAINDYIAKKLYEAPTERLQTWHQPKPIKMVSQTSEELFMREPAIAVENEIGFDFTAAPFFYLSLDGSVQKYAGNQTQGNYSPSSVYEVLTNIPAVRYGLENEDYVRHTVQQRNPHYVVRKTGLVVHPIQQYIAASPDGLIRSGEDYMIMEIKCLYNPECHSLQELINKRHDFCLSNYNVANSLKLATQEVIISFLWVNNVSTSAMSRQHVKSCRSSQSGRQDVESRNMAGSCLPSSLMTEITTARIGEMI
ncbi:SWIM-type domain-containing protein [Trichonephila clavipes]|nr:SWIM-type domain-containing protein [Trichonephila clavipes]